MDATTMTDEIETEDDTEYTWCDHCRESITQEAYDANDGLCETCKAETFVCKGCEGRTHRTNAHTTVKTPCEACGDELLEERRQERLDAGRERSPRLGRVDHRPRRP